MSVVKLSDEDDREEEEEEDDLYSLEEQQSDLRSDFRFLCLVVGTVFLSIALGGLLGVGIGLLVFYHKQAEWPRC